MPYLYLKLIDKQHTEEIRTREVGMATARIDIRLSESLKARAEKASALLGAKSLTEYIVRLMDEDSARVIQQHESIEAPNDRFDNFLHACDQAQAPNQALRDALAFTNKSGTQ